MHQKLTHTWRKHCQLIKNQKDKQTVLTKKDDNALPSSAWGDPSAPCLGPHTSLELNLPSTPWSQEIKWHHHLPTVRCSSIKYNNIINPLLVQLHNFTAHNSNVFFHHSLHTHSFIFRLLCSLGLWKIMFLNSLNPLLELRRPVGRQVLQQVPLEERWWLPWTGTAAFW